MKTSRSMTRFININQNQLITMEKEKETTKGRVTRCPVCGRYATKERVQKYEALIAAHKEALAEAKKLTATTRQAGEARQEEMQARINEMHKVICDQANHINQLTSEKIQMADDIADLTVRLDKLEARNWWQRLLNIDIDD
jgi:DNA repair exonuclease SbcCD ATPase subunit